MAKENEPVNGIVAKLVEILKELGPIEKEGRNTHFGYNYVKEGQIMAELRGRLASRGIFIFTSVESCVPEYGPDKAGVYVNVTTRHRFVDAETGECIPARDAPGFGGAGLGWDSGDKGVYKAITGAVKYFLMKNFLITDEQDPEAGEQRPAATEKPAGAKGHTRTTDYENKTGEGNKKVATDLSELEAYLTENQIPPGFLVAMLKEKKLIDERVTTLGGIKPGILRRCLAPASKANLLKAWAAQQADDAKGDTDTKAAPREAANGRAGAAKGEVRTKEGDQTRGGTRRQPATENDPVKVLGELDWREVKIHFGELENTKLGKLTRKSLVWWIENWVAKPYRKRWEPEVVLLDSALCMAADELGGEQ